MLSKNKLWRISAMVSVILLVTCANAEARFSRFGKSGLKSSVGNSKRNVTKSKNEMLRPRTSKISFTANKNNVKSVAPLCRVTGTGGFDFDNTEICARIDRLIALQDDTKNAVNNLRQDLNTKIGEMVASNKATQDLIQQQIKQNNQLLFDTLQKRLNSIPADLLTNPAFKEELEKLKKDILDEVNKRIADRQ